eukprot:3801395-Amphidinium_carterae.1
MAQSTFVHFLKQLLSKREVQRPSAAQIAKHDWLWGTKAKDQSHEGEDTNMDWDMAEKHWDVSLQGSVEVHMPPDRAKTHNCRHSFAPT